MGADTSGPVEAEHISFAWPRSQPEAGACQLERPSWRLRSATLDGSRMGPPRFHVKPLAIQDAGTESGSRGAGDLSWCGAHEDQPAELEQAITRRQHGSREIFRNDLHEEFLVRTTHTSGRSESSNMVLDGTHERSPDQETAARSRRLPPSDSKCRARRPSPSRVATRHAFGNHMQRVICTELKSQEDRPDRSDPRPKRR